MATVTTEHARPPDVRGPTSPFPLAVFVLGAAALAAIVLGTAAVQVAHAVSGGGLTAACRAEGLTPFREISGNLSKGVRGAEGVCHIVEAARSSAATVLVVIGIVLGVVAAVLGWSSYRRMDNKRKRDHAVAGAVLGIQAVVLGGVLVWFRSSHLFLVFVKDFLNFTVLKGHIGTFVTGAKNTLLLALGGEAGGIALGLILAMFAISARRVVRAPARAYINFF